MVKNIKKRLITLGLALSVILVNNSTAVIYAQNVETSEEHSFSGRGAGTKENPYQVSNAKQLDEVRNNLDAYYVQTADIDLSGIDNWEPIGSDEGTFSGQYNGNGYEINNLTIVSSNDHYVGLFGRSSGDALLRNINLKNVSINYISDYDINNSNNCVYVGSIAGSTNAITGCTAEGKINVEYTKCSSIQIGGIAGVTYADNCINKIDIFCKMDAVNNSITIGGITGFPGTVYGKIVNCINYGNIQASGGSSIVLGGISGWDGSIKKCINYGKIEGRIEKLNRYNIMPMGIAVEVGGITGYSSGEVIESVNYGEVYSYCASDVTASAGGIAGKIGFYEDGIIKNSYSLGKNIEAKLGNEYSYANRIAGDWGGYNQIFYSNYAINTQKVNGQTVNEEDCGEDTINGKTITEYPYLDYEHPEFTIGRDNNSFINNRIDFFSDGDKKNYKTQKHTIKSSWYRNKLYENQSLNQRLLLMNDQHKNWDGACYGIALSMLYSYNNQYDITKYIEADNSNKPYYSSADKPKQNNDFKDMIEVFHLSQCRSDMSYSGITYKSRWSNLINNGSDMNSFLNEIVDEAKSANYISPFYCGIAYKYIDSDGKKQYNGHSLLICGYEGITNGYHKLTICDPNSTDAFIYLMIKTDYSEFHMENSKCDTVYEGKIDSEHYTEMDYFTYEDAYSGNSNKSSRSASGDTCKLIVDADSSFYASFDDGTYLSYDGEDFSGNANIVNLDAITNGDDEAGSSWIINIGNVNSVEFTKLSEQMEVDCLFDDDDYVNVSGENLTDLTFTDDKGVIIDGDNATYDICIGDRANDDILFGASGSTSSSIQYEYSGNDIVSIGNQSREDMKLYKITDDGYQDLNQDATYDGIDILTKGDIDFNGKVDIRDLQRCVQHVSGRNELADKALLVADVNCDEKVNISDAMKLLYYVSGRNSTL